MSDHPSHPPPRTPAAAQPPATYQPTPDEAELIRLSQEWMKIAVVEKDERRLRRLMAPEFTLQIWDASQAALDLDSWMHVLLHRLAVVYSTFCWKGTMDGQPFAHSGLMADIWSRESGPWRVVARRSAPQQQVQRLQTP